MSGNLTPVSRPPRVLHFVTGGFSGGATQVAIALVRAALASGDAEPLLVLRRKSHTSPERVEELRHEGLPLRLVPGALHLLTIFALVRICRDFKPDILVAHGYSEHLWGRYAALLAGVPHCIPGVAKCAPAWRFLFVGETGWAAVGSLHSCRTSDKTPQEAPQTAAESRAARKLLHCREIRRQGGAQ